MKFYSSRDWKSVDLPELSTITGLLRGGDIQDAFRFLLADILSHFLVKKWLKMAFFLYAVFRECL